MGTKQFRTIAGRWREHAKAAGLEQLPRAEQAKAMLMFYAGFGAALDASIELADFHEIEAMHMLSSLHKEVKLVATAAEAAFSTGQAGTH